MNRRRQKRLVAAKRAYKARNPAANPLRAEWFKITEIFETPTEQRWANMINAMARIAAISFPIPNGTIFGERTLPESAFPDYIKGYNPEFATPFRQRLDIADLLDRLAEALKTTFSSRGVSLRVEHEHDVEGDFYRFMMVELKPGTTDVMTGQIRTVIVTMQALVDWGGDWERPIVIDGQTFRFESIRWAPFRAFWGTGSMDTVGESSLGLDSIIDDPYNDSQKLLR